MVDKAGILRGMAKKASTTVEDVLENQDTKRQPKVSTGSKKYNVNWDTITWAEFHTKYPEVPKSSYYNFRADNRPIAPNEIPQQTVEIQKVSSLSEKQLAICRRIAKGESETHAVEAEGIGIDQHLIWMEEPKNPSTGEEICGPTYPEMVKKCLTFSEKRVKDQLVDSIIAWKSRAWQSSAWFLERRFPAEFAKKEILPSQNLTLGINLQVTDRRAKEIQAVFETLNQSKSDPQPAIADRDQVKLPTKLQTQIQTQLDNKDPAPASDVSTNDLDISDIVDNKDI